MDAFGLAAGQRAPRRTQAGAWPRLLENPAQARKHKQEQQPARVWPVRGRTGHHGHALISRFVHSPNHHESSPEVLGLAGRSQRGSVHTSEWPASTRFSGECGRVLSDYVVWIESGRNFGGDGVRRWKAVQHTSRDIVVSSQHLTSLMHGAAQARCAAELAELMLSLARQ